MHSSVSSVILSSCHPVKPSSGFTLVELMIGIMIFSIGMTGIFALVQTAIGSSVVVRHEIVSSSLMRESLELIRNNRDTAIRNYLPWDRVRVGTDGLQSYSSGYYQVENAFSWDHIRVRGSDGAIEVAPMRVETTTVGSTIEETFLQNRLYQDQYGRYTHTVSSTPTPYASYVAITPLVIPSSPPLAVVSGSQPQAYRVTARTIVSTPGYREYEISTIITDWQR